MPFSREGFANIAVLDVSATALAKTKARLGDKGRAVRFIVADLAGWQPDLTVDLWHDRAVLHFLTESRRIVLPMRKRCAGEAVKADGFVLISGFAPSGPERCSGLPVLRAGRGAHCGPPRSRLRPPRGIRGGSSTSSGSRQRFVFTRCQRRHG